MTTFAPTATKTNPPLQLFTMFPPGGASALKSFTPSAFGAAASAGSSTSHHHIHHHSSSSSQRVDDEGPVLDHHHPPVRPVRHVQHSAAQWAETKTTVAPGLIVRSTTATVSQWSEYSTQSVQQTTELARTTSSTQFQTIRTQSIATPAQQTSAQYLDDLQLPTQQLDFAAQLGKGSIARKGSLGGRRPPTIRCRRSSQGSLAHQLEQETSMSGPIPNGGTESVRSGRSKTPPPRPPPPVFRQPEPVPVPAPSTDWSCSRSGTPPSLPANSPPPLPEREDLDFVMDELSSSASSSSPSPAPGMTDVVEINDKESVEDGEVVRRRTIITLGPRVVAPSGGSSSSINVTLLNGPAVSSSQSDLVGRKETLEQSGEEGPRPAARVSAFNARRTIEQRQRAQQPLPLPATGAAPEQPKTPPSSTYLYGEQGSPASSFGGSSLRTMSISMSFDDLESNTSISDQQRRAGGRNRTEAWYERRQSYGFEAADKLQSLLNTSGSSDVPSTGAVSRSCDSLSSTVRSTSSAIEKMIPPWIKNPSPVSSRQQPEEEKSRAGSSRLSYFGFQSMDDVSDGRQEEEPAVEIPAPPTPRTPTPSIQRSESSRSATNVLEEAEPIWLRDLRVRRSLRDGRRKAPVIKSPPPMEQPPVWLGVKLRPTGLSLVDPDPTGPVSSQPSPTKPHNYTPIFTFTNTSTSSKIQQLLRNSRENLLAEARAEEPLAPAKEPEPVRDEPPKAVEPVRMAVKKPASSIVIVNSSRESLHNIDAASSVSVDTGTNKLNHHRSIELMRMLEETPLVSTNRPLHDRMDSVSAITETGSIYSTGEWTECSSAVASVKNSNEDLTTMEVRKAKKVAFGADVKEESDQKRSRPRRIRSRSPESRLRQWQEKLEEVKSGVQSEPPISETVATASTNGLPLKMFGDDLKDKPEAVPSSVPSSSTTSDTFRSLLQPRKPYVVTTPAVKESVVIDSYPLMRASSGPADVSRPSPTVIRNGIVNFDASVERKIVILETETQAPAPKSILKKRSMENLLDSVEPVVVAQPAVHCGITVSMTNQKKEPPPEQQEVLPWRIHLKHVEPATIKVKVAEVNKEPVLAQQPAEIMPSWRAELLNNRKKTPPFSARSSTPENFFRARSRSPSTLSEPPTTIPGMSAAELIRNLRPAPVMMVARCQVRESVFRPPLSTEAETILPDPAEPSVRTDHGYHSLEVETESTTTKRHVRHTIDESKTIDETIAQLNETIEEIRSLRPETPPAEVANPAATNQSKIGSRLPENRFVVGEIRPSSVERSTFFQSKSNHHQISSTTVAASNNHHREDGYQLEAAPEATSSPNAQRLRKSTTAKTTATATSLDGGRRPPLRADLTAEADATRRVVDVTKSSSAVANIKNERQQPFVTASGTTGRDGGDDPTATASVTGVHLPIPVHHKPVVESPDLSETTVEELVSKFRSEKLAIVAEPVVLRKRIETVKSSTTSSSFSASTVATRLRSMQTKSQFSSSLKSSVAITKSQPAKRSNSIELTSGMPEEKAALLVRKFFGNSVIETKKSRMAKTETIMEESSEVGSASFSEDKLEPEEAEAVAALDAAVAGDSSFDSDELFRPSSGAEVMSTSSFGSVLDVMDTTTDDDRSIRTASSMTLTSTRYSSCSERSVKLSDIINRPDKPSLMDSPPETPLDDFSCATSESASIPISFCQTTTDTSSTGSASRSGSIRRNKTTRHPTVIRKGASVPVAPTRTPNRTRSSTKTVASTRSSTSPSTTSSTPGQRRRANGSAKPSDAVKTASATKSAAVTSSRPSAPVRPPRMLQPVNHSTETKKRTMRTSTSSSSTLRSAGGATSASAAKTTSSRTSTARSSAVATERKAVSSGVASQAPLTNRTNRLVTITSYKSRSATTKPDEISAVTGIRVTPIAVGSGHYKIRMDQRVAAAIDKTAGASQKPSSSHRSAATTLASERRSTSTRKTTTTMTTKP